MQILAQLAHIDGWFALYLYVIAASVICTVIFRGVQFRYFIRSWSTAFTAGTGDKKAQAGDMTPVQAFINTLSANLGNGTFAGMATAVHSGGPGAAIWAVLIGVVLMAVRFAEVYTSTEYGKNASRKISLGGPMLYLKAVPFGSVLSYVYGVFCLLFGLMIGNAMQANSVSLSLQKTLGDLGYPVNPLVIAVILLGFVSYVVLGGASRIIKISDGIVPVKVLVFFTTSFIVLAYHYDKIVPALSLMVTCAFNPTAVMGGLLGFTVQQAIHYGAQRSIMASEAGLGTAAVLFGFTGSKDSFQSALMGMLSAFISTAVCFLVALCIVVSGVFSSGLTSAPLIIAAYTTVFGAYAGVIVSFLSMSFGLGVLVTFAYVSRVVWLFLTGGRWASGITVLYCAATLIGALIPVDKLWALLSIPTTALLLINLYGVVYLAPSLARSLYSKKV